MNIKNVSPVCARLAEVGDNFSGRGTVWCQSHNAKGFGMELGPELKPR